MRHQIKYVHLFLFVIIILVSFYTRLNKFEYPLATNGGEGTTAYLVADHILQFKEFPLFAQDGGRGILKYNSPFYYYLIALILTLKNDIIFLGLANIFLQVLSIFLIYLLAKKSFGPTQAIIASSLFSFNPIVLQQSIFVWQPYLMQPFVHFSIFLLLLAYFKQKFYLLLASIFFLIFSIAIYKAAFAFIPLYVLVILKILKKQKRNMRHYAIISATAIISLLLFYASVIIFLIKASFNHNSFLSELLAQKKSGHEYIQSFGDIFMNFSFQVKQLFSIFSLPTQLNSGWNGATFSLLIITISILIYFLFYKNQTSKKITMMLIFFIIQQVFFSSFFKVSESSRFLSPILGLFTILIAETIYSVFSLNIFSKVIMMIVLFFLFQTITFNFQFLRVNKASSQNFQNLEITTDHIIVEIFKLQKEEGFPDINFFQIESYRNGNQPARDAILWTPLEKKLNRKFTIVDNGFEDDHPLKETNGKKLLFLACFSQENHYETRACQETFSRNHVDYMVVKEVYNSDNISIFLTKPVQAI